MAEGTHRTFGIEKAYARSCPIDNVAWDSRHQYGCWVNPAHPVAEGPPAMPSWRSDEDVQEVPA